METKNQWKCSKIGVIHGYKLFHMKIGWERIQSRGPSSSAVFNRDFHKPLKIKPCQ